MPLYDYRCRGCGKDFEALVRPGHPARCPECGGEDLERQLSIFAVSSKELSKAHVASARKQLQKAKRDEVIAQQEMEEKHHH
jgi:putative FmdB family regulatory protein